LIPILLLCAAAVYWRVPACIDWSQTRPVTAFEFPSEDAIPYNAVDPAADPGRRDLVIEKMLMLMGE
jgi:hypothetical protein